MLKRLKRSTGLTLRMLAVTWRSVCITDYLRPLRKSVEMLGSMISNPEPFCRKAGGQMTDGR
jgi:hypothetical protein